MLRRIELNNFQKHTHLEVVFSAGTNLVVGQNWAGKSTLFRAILFALFGSSVIPGGMKILQQRGEKKRPKVEMDFSLLGIDYSVSRSASSASLKRGEETIATGAAVVTQEIEKLLGLSGKLFYQLRYSPQEEAASILTLGSTKLSDVINEITQVDVVDRVISLAGERKKARDTELAVMPAGLTEGLEEQAQEQLAALHITFAELEKLKQRLDQQTEACNNALEYYRSVNARRTEWVEYERQTLALQGELASYELRLGQLKGMCSEGTLTDLAEEEARSLTAMQSQEAVLANLQHKWDTYAEHSRKIMTQEQSMGQLRASLAQQRESLEAADHCDPEDLKQLEKTAEDLGKQMEVQWQENTQLREEVESGVCSACGRAYEEGFDKEEKLERIAQLDDERAGGMKYLRKLEEEIRRKVTEVTNISHLQGGIEALEAQLAQEEQTMGRLQEELDALPSVSRDELEIAKLNLGEYQKDLATAQAELRSANNAKDEYDRTMAYIAHVKERLAPNPSTPRPVSQEELDESFSSYNGAKVRQDEAAQAHTQLNSTYTSAYYQYQDLEKRVTAEKEAAQARREKEQDAQRCTALSKYLRGNRDRFLEQAWADILGFASLFVKEASGGVLTGVARTDQGQFQYEEHGQWMPVAAASGLQKAILGTGVRIALAEAVRTPAAFCLLDEVTAGASDENSMVVIRALSLTGSQAVVVTHRQADAAVADSVTHV